MPLISVIVPVYEVEPYLRRCVDSILVQTFADFELILVDDGSPDRCGAICDEYAQKDVRVHVIHQKNGGLSAARNAGIDWAFANSDSQWLTFIDSDDWVHPHMLEYMYSAVQRHNMRLCICAYTEFEIERPLERYKSVTSYTSPVESYYVENWVQSTVACAKLYYKECFSEIRYPNGKIYEDGYVTYKLLFMNKEIAVIDEPLYAYYINPNGITKSGWTPARMDGIQSLEEQLRYFTVHKFDLAKKACIDRYVNSLCGQCIRIREEAKESEKKEAFRYVRPKLAIALIKYHKRFPFEKKNWYIYENAFPRLMQAYWLMRAVPGKIKRTLRR